MTTSVTVTTPAAAEAIWVLGDRLRFMGEVAGGEVHALEITVPPGSGTPPHRHRSFEVFQVIEGEVTFGVFDDGPPRSTVAGPGAVVSVPSGAAHNYTNASGREARMLVILERQMIDFFREIGATAPPPPGPPSEAVIARLMEAAGRHGVEIMAGPPPG